MATLGTALVAAAALSGGIADAAGGPAPGSLDPSFGTAGITYTQFSAAATKPSSEATGVVTGSDGSIYVAGDATSATGNEQLVVAKYTSAGQLDTSFGSSGYAVVQAGQGTSPQTAGGGVGSSFLALAPNGDVIALAASSSTSSAGVEDQLAVVALTPAGKLDTSFNARGSQPGVLDEQLSTNASPNTYPGGLAIQPDGKIVLAAEGNDTAGNAEIFVQRLGANGALDTTFGTGGTYTYTGTAATGQAADAAGQAADAAGLIIDSSGDPALAAVVKVTDPATGASHDAYELLRLNAAGQLAAGFTPTAVAPVPGSDGTASPTGLVQQADGDYVLAGTAASSTGHDELAAVAFKPSGAVDPGFGSAGVIAGTFGSGSESAVLAVTQQADGVLLLAGGETNAQGVEQAVLALTPAGTPDTSFGSNGVALTPVGGDAHAAAQAATVAPNGELVLGGAEYEASGEERAFLDELTLPSPPVLHVDSVKVRSGDVIKVKLGATGGAIKGALTLSALEHLTGKRLVAVTAETSAKAKKRRTRTVKLATKSVTVKNGKTVTLTLKPNKVGLALLKRFKPLHAKLAVAERSPQRATVATRKLSLRPPPKPHKQTKKKQSKTKQQK